MAVPAFSHHSRPTSPPTAVPVSTPARTKSARAVSPSRTSLSYSTTITPGHQQKLNVVTRVAVEGKARRGQDGASVKMYLKISLPLDSITPGTTIPLFPEENVKILTSQVHPIDNNSVPYNFSSTISPLLHNAARALNLPARSSDAFTSVFNISTPATASSAFSSKVSKSTNSYTGSENIAPIDQQYTGHILVSGYNISYVLPKVFPLRRRTSDALTDNEGEEYTSFPVQGRRPSIGERNAAQFMAAIDMWVPYVSRPPRHPYLLSIPTPRCLHNNIKLRIFPPTTASASFASLSSIDDDGGSWDLTSDPHVTRSASTRPSRSNSYTHFADDESSDSSTAGFSTGCGIQGTFPSAERIRIRWAKPMKTVDIPEGKGDGRRRVGVKEASGEMICIVRGQLKDRERNDLEGVLMDVEYKGTCRGVWFPGVATLLGMDVGLEAKGSDVSWVDGSPNEWRVDGGVGYTGFDIGASPRQSGVESRTSSFDSNPGGGGSVQLPAASRQTSISSISSLLRAPLPARNVAEYSFEGSTPTVSSSVSSPVGTLSSMSSLMPVSATNSATRYPRPPAIPITLHVNMNEIIAPAKNIFTFSIYGTILVTPRPSLTRVNSQGSRKEHDMDVNLEPFVLPRFTVLAADAESTSITIRNEINGAPVNIEVYNPTGDILKDAQARKTVLQKGGLTKCGEDGVRIALRNISMPNGNGKLQRPGTPNGNAVPQVSPNPSDRPGSRSTKDGPLLVPSVHATVTPLLLDGQVLPFDYTVRICLNAPANADSEWLEFGLAQPGSSSSTPPVGEGVMPPHVVIASASINGIPVKFGTAAIVRPGASGIGVPFEQMSGTEWVTWLSVHVGALGGGAVVVDYVVRQRREDRTSRKGKGKAKNESLLNVLLPTFSIPVGRLEVCIDTPSGVDVSSLRSNLAHQQTTPMGHRLLHFSAEEFFYPHLSVTIHSGSTLTPFFGLKVFIFATWAVLLVGAIFLYRHNTQLNRMEHTLDSYSVMDHRQHILFEPVTITTTVYSTSGTRWWFDVPTGTEPVSPLAVTATPLATTATSPTSLPESTFSSTLLSTGTKDESFAPRASFIGDYTLLPLQYVFQFSWPVDDLRATLDKVMETLETVWEIFRRAYHYPLDPP